MAKRRSRRTPKTVVEEELPAEEELLEEEDVEEEFDDEEEEEDAPPPAKKPARRSRSRRKPAAKPVEEDDEEDEPLDEEDEEEAPPAKSSRTTRRKKDRRQVPAAEVLSADPDDKLGQGSAAELAEVFYHLLKSGITLTIRKVGQTFIISEGVIKDDVADVLSSRGRVRKALTGKQVEEITYSDEFKEYYEEWSQLSYEEKVAKAEEEGVEWERHENAKVDLMKLSTAYRIHHGIEKYRPEYQDGKVRKLLRDHGLDAVNDYFKKVAQEEVDDEEEEEDAPPPAKKKTTRSRRRK
jgi:hypothetical protein